MKKYQTRIFFVWVLVWLIELYFYQAASQTILEKGSQGLVHSLLYPYLFSIDYTAFICVLSSVYPVRKWKKFFRIYATGLAAVFVIGKALGVMMLMLDDLVRLLKAGYGAVSNFDHVSLARIPLFSHLAVLIASFFVCLLIFGMFVGPGRIKVRRKKIGLHKLPKHFDGLRIAHISDLHIGTFASKNTIRKIVDKLLDEKPDVVFFTGDLVNNRATEVLPFFDELKRMQAPDGIFSVLGNHDYGDYVDWETPEMRNANLEHLIDLERSLGWKVLLNENIQLGTGNDMISIVGVENWGARRGFQKYGDLHVAYAGADIAPVTLLLSHDPSHFEHVVQKEFRQIDITFSGHTHGFQFGFERGHFKWSPSRWLYRDWIGLCKYENQYLYVNRGLGMLGYPGRVGIYPEIAIITLVKR